MDLLFLRDIVIIFTLAIAVSYVCFRLGVPAILAYLLTGALAGPFGLGLVQSRHEVEILAEMGVVLLLFTIGIEFSLKKLLEIRRLVFLGGLLQVGGTALATAGIAGLGGLEPGPAVFMGLLISLSSTAIVLKVLQDRGEIESPAGKTALGILIFQDLMIVPMMIATPFLGPEGASGTAAHSPWVLVLGGLGVLVMTPIAARWIVPEIMYRVAQTRSRELFLLTVVLICFGVAYITHAVGLSLALGAFLAGLVISESEYSHDAMGSAIPFRDAFTSFFFVSIGMLLNARTLVEQPFLIIGLTLAVIVFKAWIAGSAAVLVGMPLRAALVAGFALSQVGEFAFILAGAGLEYKVMNADHYQVFLAVSILTMAITPFIIAATPGLVELVRRLPLPKHLLRGTYLSPGSGEKKYEDHLLIIGYGINGRNVSRAARAAGVDFAVLDLNPETVRTEHAAGVPIYFGDATNLAVLEHLGVDRARVVVVVINDPAATRRIVEQVRRKGPGAHLIVRTRYVHEMSDLYEIGADQVIPEEFETSVEIFSRVLARYLLGRDEIEKLVGELRADNYEMFRGLSGRGSTLSALGARMPDLQVSKIHADTGEALGQTLARLDLRRRHGVTVLAIQRADEVLPHPDGDALIQAGDQLFLLGGTEKIVAVQALFSD